MRAAILPAGAMTLGPSLRPILAGGPQEARTASRPHFPSGSKARQDNWAPVRVPRRDPYSMLSKIHDRVTGRPVEPRWLRTYAEALRGYHLHPETKFLDGDYTDRGPTRRRHIFAQAIEDIGKEADKWDDEEPLTKHAVRVISEGLRQEVKPYNIRTTIVSPGRSRPSYPTASRPPALRKRSTIFTRNMRSHRQLRPLRAFRHEPAGRCGRERDPIQAYVAGIVTAAFARDRPAYHPRPRFPRSTGGFGDRSRRKSLMRHQ